MIKQYTTGMQITEPCYVSDMPADVYHAHDSASSSGLRLLLRSPDHFKNGEEKDQTRAMILGSALHMACLEPDIFYDTYILLRWSENRMSSEYKTAKKEYGEEFVLVKPEIDKIEGMAKSLSASAIAEYIDNEYCDNKELSGFAIDPETGLMCRHRFDVIIDGIAIDLKTTTDARKPAFSKKILDFGYHIQAAFYADQYKWIAGEEIESFMFAAIETSAPYAVKIYELEQDSMEAGRKKYRQALNEYAQCKATDTWPSYDQEIETIGIPQWALEKNDIDDFIFTDEE